MMLQILVSKPQLRKEALKVISFALIKCTVGQATQFIDKTRGLSIVFGLWTSSPELAGQGAIS